MQADIGFDLTKAKIIMGDFSQSDLENSLDKADNNAAIARVYQLYAKYLAK